MKLLSSYSRFTQLSIPVLFAMAIPELAYAHTGIGSTAGWAQGFTHPMAGADHVLAMVAVGLWATQMGGRALWLIPLTFVAVMTAGGVAGIAAVPMAYAEQGIILSLLVLGVLIAAAIRLPLLASAALAGVFAIFHGYTHGNEMPHSISGLSYVAGFTLSTALLHLSGIGIAQFTKIAGREQWLRLAGMAIALCGGSFLLAG